MIVDCIVKEQPAVIVTAEEKSYGMLIENMTKLEAIKELSTFDHAFLTKEGVEEFCKPFGFDPKEFLYEAQDQRSQFKGLYIPEGKEGDWYEGAAADQLAADFCHKLGVTYPDMSGRGSRLEACCNALIEYLTE